MKQPDFVEAFMDTRGRMLDAAEHVMRTKGLARATTKEIARESGFSEAALYKHFRDKTDLFLAVLRERTPGHLPQLLAALAERPGGILRENLLEVARTAIEFYNETFPMAASIFSEPTLLAAHKDALVERGTGPQHVRDALARYLEGEQQRGKLAASADPAATATLLLGACFMQAFLANFTDQAGPSAEALVDALLTRQSG